MKIKPKPFAGEFSSSNFSFPEGIRNDIQKYDKELAEKDSARWFLTDDIPDLIIDYEEMVEPAQKSFLYAFPN